MPRIVSLLPATTEIVHALGRGDDLVGRSHECDHPPEVERLPVVTEPKVWVGGDSAAIDRQVGEILEQALSVYKVHADVLRELAPDLVLTQSQCEVCAVSADDVQQAVNDHLDGDAEVVALEPNALSDVLDDVRRVAAALDIPDRGDELATSMSLRIAAIAERTVELSRRRVVTLEWIDPLMAAGNWMPELLEAAGGQELFGRAGQHSPWLDWDVVVEADPDAIVVLPCGFDLARTREQARALTQLPGWSQLRAVREGRVALVDGHRFCNRPGPRLVESTQILAEIVQPDAFAPSYLGDAWEPISPRSA